MGNIGTTLKRFVSNKNTVTILGVLVGIIVLYVGYNYRVKKAVDTVEIPYAKKTLNATTAIQAEDVGKMKVLQSTIRESKTIISNYNAVVNPAQTYCVSERTNVPEGGFFYKDQIKLCTAINSNVLREMPDGYRPVSLKVDLQKTYGNSMYPGNYIDLYVRMDSESGKLIYGEFITKLPILDVRDSNGQSLFYGASSTNTPAILLFAVPNNDPNDSNTNLYLLLSKATMLSDIELIPVPGNKTYTSEVGETRVTSEFLKNQILNRTLNIPDSSVTTEE